MEFLMLGPLELRDGARQVVIGGAKQRRLLARLLLDRGRVVSTDSLVDALWPAERPSDPSHQVQVYVSQIRKALGSHAAALETAHPGYRLRTGPDDVDLDRFERLCAQVRAAVAEADHDTAVVRSDEAVALWRGPFLHGFEGEDFAYAASVRAEALRSQLENDRLTALLESGRAGGLIPELEARAAAAPQDERVTGLLMRAYRHEGRQADAIEAFHRCRAALAEQLGVHPSAELQALLTGILRGEPPAPAPVAAVESVDVTREVPRGGSAMRAPVVLAAAAVVAAAAVAAAVVLMPGSAGDDAVRLRPNSLAAIDEQSGRRVGSATLPVRATRVAYGLGSVWVTSASSGQVVKLDPETLSVRQQINVGPGAGPIAIADGAVWVANVDDGTVSRIDPGTSEVVQRVHAGNGPTDMAAVGDQLWISTRLDGAIVKFDARRGEVVRRIPLGVSPAGLAATPDALWVADELSSVVTQIDLTTERTLATVHVGSGAGSVTADGDAVWVVNRSDETVSRIGPSGSVEATLALGRGPSRVVSVNGVPWAATLDGIERIDADGPLPTHVVASGAGSSDLVVGAGRIWVVTEPSAAEHSGGVLRLLSQQLDSLDPAEAYTPESWRLLEALNDGLVAYGGPDGRALVANLAVRVPAPTRDGTEYTFRMRDGVRYSTGEPVTADDVRRSFERMLGSGAAPAGLFAAIKGAPSCLQGRRPCDLRAGIVTSAAARSVTFHLSRPDPEFVAKLATPPASLLPPSVPMAVQRSVPSTGPYAVTTYQPDQQIVLERRPDFTPWAPAAQPRGFVDRIVVQLAYREPASQVVLSGDADWADVSGLDVSDLRRRHGSRIREYPRPAVYAVSLNVQVPPFDDVDVRRALNLAVDREAVQHAFGGPEQSRVTCQILPPGLQGYTPYCPYTAQPGPAGQWRRPDVERAQRLLEGKPRPPVVVHAFPEVADSAQIVVSALRQLGYRAEVAVLPMERFFAEMQTRPDLQAGVFGWFADGFGAFGFTAPTFGCAGARSGSGSTNFPHFCDRTVDRLSREAGALQLTDALRANAIWAQVDRRLTDAAPWVPLVNPKGVELVSERLGNYTYSPLTGMVLSQVWVR